MNIITLSAVHYCAVSLFIDTLSLVICYTATMQPTLQRYHEVVQKALAFMRNRSETHPTVTEVAIDASYSTAQLRHIFKQVTGRSILAHLRDIRLEKAKQLLRQTTLNISEVAYAAGFENHSAFARLFRLGTGTSPGLFRKTMQTGDEVPASATNTKRTKETSNVLRDDFTTAHLADCWQPAMGVWTPQQGYLQGAGQGFLKLQLKTPLPENFRLEFDLLVKNKPHSRFRIFLQNAENDTNYCEIALPHPNSSPGVLRINNRNLLWSPDAVVAPEYWHTIRVELNDNHIVMFLNGKSIFAFREIFPPPYSRRCRVALASYENTVNIRRFRLFDLGFLAVVSAVRQGDTLFNTGLFIQAKEFYQRHLQANLSPADEMELRFKIGMCLLRQHHFDHCRDWMHSILPLAKDPFWRRECDLVLLQLDADTHAFNVFLRHVRNSFRDPSLRDGIRPIIAAYYFHMRSVGFYDLALKLAELSITLEKENLALATLARSRVANILKNMKSFREATRHLQLLCRHKQSIDVQIDAYVSFSDLFVIQNKIPEARQAIIKVRKLSEKNTDLAWCTFQEAICLRTEQRFDAAIKTLLAIPAQHPEAKPGHLSAAITAANILCCLGKTKAAQRIVKRIRTTWPKDSAPENNFIDDYMLVSLIVAKRYAKLAAFMLPKARLHDDQLSVHGQEAVTVGIMLELAGKRAEANQVWGETFRRFPSSRCYFWGPLAKALASEKPDHLETMRLPFRVRSQMFFLAGLLYEYRGHATHARNLFALSVKEDPTLNWPAHLALRHSM